MFDYSASFVHRQYGILGRSIGAPQPPTDWVAVALDRPGYGSSTGSWATKEWTYEDFARDVEAVADAIGVDRFYVSGHSSGGPCALACAAHIPERIIGAGVMAGDCEYAEDGAPQLGQFPEGCAFVFGRYIMCGPVRKSNFRRPRHRRDVVSVNASA
jgi:pimeloyl-ACP methyl ester carboxylesterase